MKKINKVNECCHFVCCKTSWLTDSNDCRSVERRWWRRWLFCPTSIKSTWSLDSYLLTLTYWFLTFPPAFWLITNPPLIRFPIRSTSTLSRSRLADLNAWLKNHIMIPNIAIYRFTKCGHSGHRLIHGFLFKKKKSDDFFCLPAWDSFI